MSKGNKGKGAAREGELGAVMDFAATGLKGNAEIYDGVDLTEENVALLKMLQEINGQDAYSSTSATVTGTSKDEYLALPDGVDFRICEAKDVGRAEMGTSIKLADIAQVYALNYDRAPPGEDAAKYAMVRVEAVRMGWVDDQREIIRLPRDPEAVKKYLQALKDHSALIPNAKTVAFIVPLAAEHVFRTMGHHYITGAAADYEEKYRRVLRACLLDNLANWMRGPTLFHHALHWVSPARVKAVIEAQADNERIPDAIKIRSTSAPAGTALVTTTAAVLKAMKSSKLDVKIQVAGGIKTNLIEGMTEKIQKTPHKYHRAYYAYAIAGPSEEEIRELEAAKEEAIALAPIAQAYINVVFKGTQLANAKALQKHAEVDPQRLRLAEKYFKTALKRDTVKFEELFDPLESDTDSGKEEGV